MKHIIPADFYKSSTHLLRCVYCRYIYEFRNEKRKTLSAIISKYLGHSTPDSASHYQYVVFDKTVYDVWDDPPIDYNAMTVPQLKDLCKDRGLTRYSKLPKPDLILLLDV